MIKILQLNRSIKDYLPLFFLLCLSGNPYFVAMSYSKILLTGYALIFSLYVFHKMEWMLPVKISHRLFGIITTISILVIFQRIILGFVSYPGAFVLVLKIVLGLFTILFYNLKKIDILETYIKIIALLSLISIPFFILNQFGFYGIEIGEIKSLILFTSFPKDEQIVVRSAGMFWEPGAYSGYLILALLFIALKNRRFIIGSYQKETLWIIIGLGTSQSTTGFMLFLLILMMYSLQNYKWGRLIVVPLFLLVATWAYTGLPFMKEKIEDQYNKSNEMSQGDISNSRFGSLNMDMEYIKSQPIIGNGLDNRTRYRFHPEISPGEDIGNGNGMSNFVACWGIPFFLFWFYCVYQFARYVSQSKTTAFAFTIMILLLLQGEQYLNFPMFLMFFSLPFAYVNRIGKTTF